MNAQEFTKKYYVDRKNTNCIKWDSEDAKGTIPAWIADADFKAPEKVVENLERKIAHGSYGYGFLPEDYYKEMIAWNKKVSGVTYKKDWIRFSKGAVNGLSQVINSLTKEKDAILINTPAYHPFPDTIKKTKRKIVESALTRKGSDFFLNFEDIEKKIIKNNVKAMILCSPHNPVGRVWTKQELETLFKITHKHKVLVISDEVHSELIMPGTKFIPSLLFKQYQNEIVTLNAESKTFSLALFAHCHIIVPNEKLRKKLDDYRSYHNMDSVNAYCGLSSYYAYKYGYEWLQGFKAVIYENYQYLKEELGNYCDIPKLEGSYLVYADFSKSLKKKTAYSFLKDDCKILVNPGEQFAKGYEKWARINLATSLDNVKKICSAIKKNLKDTK